MNLKTCICDWSHVSHMTWWAFPSFSSGEVASLSWACPSDSFGHTHQAHCTTLWPGGGATWDGRGLINPRKRSLQDQPSNQKKNWISCLRLVWSWLKVHTTI